MIFKSSHIYIFHQINFLFQVFCKMICKKRSEQNSFCSESVENADLPVFMMQTDG